MININGGSKQESSLAVWSKSKSNYFGYLAAALVLVFA